MPPGTKLSRPPIVEAMIDFRVQPRADVTVDQLDALHESFDKEAFPTKSKQVTGTIEFGDAPKAIQQPSGFIFRSADQTQVIQAQRDGFAYSRLVPYTSWEEVTASTKQRWAQYAAVARPTLVTRIATRYINRVDLPQPIHSFEDWIRTFPDVPPGLPQGLAQALQRLVIPISGTNIVAIVILAVEPYQPDGQTVRVVFDIDVFRPGAWRTDGDSDEMWSAVEELRGIKNSFFYAYLTDKTLEMYR